MNDGLIWLLVLAPVVAFLGYAIVGWLNYRENPLYVKAQLKMLKVGHVKANKLTPEGEGHTVYVVKQIDGKKIICDTYKLKSGKYAVDRTDWEFRAKEFFDFTDPEPVYFDSLPKMKVKDHLVIKDVELIKEPDKICEKSTTK